MAKELTRPMVWDKISNADGLGALDTALKWTDGTMAITRFDPVQLGRSIARCVDQDSFLGPPSPIPAL